MGRKTPIRIALQGSLRAGNATVRYALISVRTGHERAAKAREEGVRGVAVYTIAHHAVFPHRACAASVTYRTYTIASTHGGYRKSLSVPSLSAEAEAGVAAAVRSDDLLTSAFSSLPPLGRLIKLFCPVPVLASAAAELPRFLPLPALPGEPDIEFAINEALSKLLELDRMFTLP